MAVSSTYACRPYKASLAQSIAPSTSSNTMAASATSLAIARSYPVHASLTGRRTACSARNGDLVGIGARAGGQ